MRLLLVSAALLGVASAAEYLGDTLDKYFNSEISHIVVDVWKQNKISYENSLKRALVSDVGRAQANIYVPAPSERPLALAPGFLTSDNVVELLLTHLSLRELPLLDMEPQASIDVPGGFVRLYASLREMFVDAQYVVFRNASALQRRPAARPLVGSPFTYQQVKKEGNVTITVEDCSVSGYVVLRLDGTYVKLGHDTLRVNDCKYTVEIDNGLETPPVIAPYFAEDVRKELNRIVTKPVKEMLVSKLQAFFFSNMNLTSVFRDKLPEFRQKQAHALGKSTAKLVSVAGRLNRAVAQSSGGAMSVPPAEIAIGEQFQGKLVEYKFTISDMTLNGLESAYSSSTGGPINDTKIVILDQIKYDVLQVHGEVQYSDAAKNSHSQRFRADLYDVAVDVAVEPDAGRRVLRASEVHGLGWRKIELSITNLMHNNMNRQFVYDLIAGYLENSILVPLELYISKVYNNALDDNAKIPDDSPDETTCMTTEDTTCYPSDTPSTPETTCITTDAPVDTTCITTDTPVDTTSVTTDKPIDTTCITTDTPVDTTCITTDATTDDITDAPNDETTCITTDTPDASTEEPDIETTCVTTDATDNDDNLITTDHPETTGIDIKLPTRCTTNEPINVNRNINIDTDDFEVREVTSNVLNRY